MPRAIAEPTTSAPKLTPPARSRRRLILSASTAVLVGAASAALGATRPQDAETALVAYFRSLDPQRQAAFLGSLEIASTLNPSATGHLDAELIAMCDEYVQLEADYGRLCWADGDYVDTPECNAASAEFKVVRDRQHALNDPIIDAEAQTVAGLRARARAVVAYYRDDFRPRGPADSFMWAIVCDLIDGDVA